MYIIFFVLYHFPSSCFILNIFYWPILKFVNSLYSYILCAFKKPIEFLVFFPILDTPFIYFFYAF